MMPESKLQIVQDWFREGPSPLPVDIVVPVSGGKDSQACLKLACRERDEGRRGHVIGLFCDTRFEHPITYEHVDRLQDIYNVKIVRAQKTSVEYEVKKARRFPGGGARHCTSELKLGTSKKFYRALAILQDRGFEVWCGMRSNESKEREKRYQHCVSDEVYYPHEIFPSNYPQYLSKLGVLFRLPILNWDESDVLNFIGDDRNPLYGHGFSRIGCFPCLAGGDANMIRAFEFDDFGRSQYEKVKDMQKWTGRTCFHSNIGRRWEEGLASKDEIEAECGTNPGCAICSI